MLSNKTDQLINPGGKTIFSPQLVLDHGCPGKLAGKLIFTISRPKYENVVLFIKVGQSNKTYQFCAAAPGYDVSGQNL